MAKKPTEPHAPLSDDKPVFTEMTVTRSDLPGREVAGSFATEGQAIAAFIKAHGKGVSGASYTFTKVT